MDARRSIMWAVILMGLFGTAVPADDRATVRAWLEAELVDHERLPPKGLALTFDQLHYSPLGPSQLEAMRREIEGRPDHPGRRIVEAAERRLQDGPDVTRWTVWIGSDTKWRANRTFGSRNGAEYLDSTTTGGVAWQLTPNSLVTVDASAPPRNRDISSSWNTIASHIDLLLRGGIGRRARSVEITNIRDLDVQGESWAATIEHELPSGAPVLNRFSGRFDYKLGRGFVAEKELLDTAVEDAIGRSVKISDWQRLPDGEWVAGRVENYGPEGRLDSALEFREARRFTPAELDRLVEMPDPLGADPVRGAVTVRTVLDYRPRTPTRADYDDGRLLSERQLTSHNEVREQYKRTGWIAAVLLGCVLAAIALRRRSVP